MKFKPNDPARFVGTPSNTGIEMQPYIGEECIVIKFTQYHPFSGEERYEIKFSDGFVAYAVSLEPLHKPELGSFDEMESIVKWHPTKEVRHVPRKITESV